MGTGNYVLFINIALAGFVATGYAYVYFLDRTRKQALWWIAAAGMVLLNGAIEAVMPFLASPPALRVLIFCSFMLALGFLGAGVCRHYRVRFPWRTALALFAGSVCVNIAILDMERSSTLRLFLYHTPYFLMLGFSTLTALRLKKKSWLDNLLLAVLLALSLHFLLRPLTASLLGGMGQDASSYLSSRYAAFDQTALAILGIALVSSLALLLAQDVVNGLVTVSVTDPLSGLLNRRGFLEKANRFVEASRASQQKVFLVIADIDNFKTINDTHGHETGDRVIQSFGDLLGRLSTSGTNVARIGGEEFAAVFQSPNEALARLYCESIRMAVQAGAADKHRDLPSFTVSLGLAGLMPGECLEGLTRRADLALYRAKKAGRNRVVVSETGAEPAALAPVAA